jgi:hypothetical protein
LNGCRLTVECMCTHNTNGVQWTRGKRI